MTTGLLSSQFSDTTSTDPFVPWSRPSDWLSITSLEPTIGQQKIVMLCAVQPTNSYFAFTISGAYNIDWGDGTSTVNVAAGVKTSKILQWSSYSGSTLTSRGYRQAIITIVPQAGQNFTSLDFTVAHSPPPASLYPSPILDMIVAGPNVTSMAVGGNGIPQAPRYMERFRYVGTNVITSAVSMFQMASSLRTVAATNGQGYDLWLSSSSSFSNMFNNCLSLEAGPQFSNTAALTNTTSMFSNCGAMRSVNLFNTANVTVSTNMFNGCSALTSVPAFDWSSLANGSSMFASCSALTSIPAANTPVLSSLQGVFASCSALQAAPAWNYSKVTDFSSAFSSCYILTDVSNLSSSLATGLSSLNTTLSSTFASCRALTTLPPINTSGVTIMLSTFSACSSLSSLPTPSGNNWKTSACTSFNAVFNSCGALAVAPSWDTSAGTNFTNAFSSCTSLVTGPDWNVAKGTTFVAMFSLCTSMQSVKMNGARFTFTVASCLLSATALDALYTSLGTAAAPQSITVTGNFGITSDTPTIATAKNWTVTGS